MAQEISITWLAVNERDVNHYLIPNVKNLRCMVIMKGMSVIEFDGCLWHGCIDCYSFNTHLPFGNKTMRELYAEQKQKEFLLTRSGFNI